MKTFFQVTTTQPQFGLAGKKAKPLTQTQFFTSQAKVNAFAKTWFFNHGLKLKNLPMHQGLNGAWSWNVLQLGLFVTVTPLNVN